MPGIFRVITDRRRKTMDIQGVVVGTRCQVLTVPNILS